MKIEIVVDPTKPAPAASLASRVAPAPAAVVEAAPRTGGRPGRGRGRGAAAAGGGRRKANERPQKTAADLDAEMEDYTAHNAPAA
ncbi:hypothetical protein K466DRAFT_581050 [Polyporus arcularius HHB13444]|uniref:Chromatin target of PRMT1 protein C-terminal domain-containing protein n=1 Tax=Polyporus arcularius HHB13444 TaxID=1314778 RepID=A0A5C3PU65_9APHY|nr:hypothetical protein K466DRAFT_581050 [Polyporus arcularius HHB13444]